MTKTMKKMKAELALDKMILLGVMLDRSEVKIVDNCHSLGGERCIRVQVEDISLLVYKGHGLFGSVYYSIDGMKLTPKIKEKLLHKIRLCRAAQQRDALSQEIARIRACRTYVSYRNCN